MDGDESDAQAASHSGPVPEPDHVEAVDDQPADEAEAPVTLRDFSEWRGKDLIDEAGEKIGKLEDVYFDVETDEPQFGTVKEGLFGRHLTFVPLTEVIIGPNDLQVRISKSQVRDAPNIESEGDALTQDDESTLYHYYKLNYSPSDTPSGRRLARR
jgi:sporulation protein YlmC with PRC-barrel domain